MLHVPCVKHYCLIVSLVKPRVQVQRPRSRVVSASINVDNEQRMRGEIQWFVVV